MVILEYFIQHTTQETQDLPLLLSVQDVLEFHLFLGDPAEEQEK